MKQRQKELTSGIQGLTMDNDMEKTESERVDIFHDFVKAKIDAGVLGNSSKEVHAEAERLEVANKAPIVLCELLFGETMIAPVSWNIVMCFRRRQWAKTTFNLPRLS